MSRSVVPGIAASVKDSFPLKGPSEISIRMVSSTEEFASLDSAWNSLLSRSSSDDFFLRWEWLFTWWKIFGLGPARLRILLVERGEELIGIAPFYVRPERRYGFLTERTLLFLGSGEAEEEEIFSEYLDVICKVGEEEAVVRGLMEFIIAQGLCDTIRLFNILLSSKTLTILKQFCDDRRMPFNSEFKMESPYARLPSTWDDYLQSLSSSMRHEIRSDRRKLEKMGVIRMERTTRLEDFEDHFKELVKLHSTRWASKEMRGAFENPKFASFHQTVMPTLLKNGHLQLWFLSLSSKNIATCYNIQYNNKVYFYQTGLDFSAAPKISGGLVLKSYCIEDAIRSKQVEYDFMGGGGMKSYKGRWANDCRALGEIDLPLSAASRYLRIMRNIVRGVKKKLSGS